MAAEPLLSVVVPTRNEADNVRTLVARMRTVLGDVPHEILFVDDSDDETPALLDELEHAHPEEVRSLQRQGAERAGGLSTAVVSGLRMARGRYVCVMDADLQHPPETITTMLAAIQSGADLVVASRYTGGGAAGGLDGVTRRLVSRGATALARALFVEARRSSDPLSGFFLCRRQLIDGIEFRPVGFKILLELLVCVPGITVRDVPMSFQARHAGESKASMRQGLMYLRHVRSLVFEVRGSARPLKFALVGLTGLAIFLPTLTLLAVVAGWPALLAFVPAFLLSLVWNATLNRVWTYADQRRRSGGEGPRHHLERSVAAGLVMFACFAALQAAGVRLLPAGVGAALLGMAVNGLANLTSVRHGQASPWSRAVGDSGLQKALVELAQQLGADRAYLLPTPINSAAAGALPSDVLARAAGLLRPVLWTEAPSYRPQRRTNIDWTSALVVPVVSGPRALALVVCERRAPHGFDDAALSLATVAVDRLRPALLQVTGSTMPPRPPGRAAAPAD